MNGDELKSENIFTTPISAQANTPIRRDWRGISYAAFQELQKQELREYIVAKIQENGGSVTKTAESFGMQRPALYALARRLGLDISKRNK